MVKILGLDEVGLGSAISRIYVCGFLTPDDLPEWWSKLTDSKALTEKERETFYTLLIKTYPSNYHISYKDEKFIDTYGVSKALELSYQEILDNFSNEANTAILDGNKSFGLPVQTLVKGDSLVKEIAAASIIAKHTRDSYIKFIAPLYPNYPFTQSKGYLTADHIAAIKKYGKSEIHRKSYLIKGIDK